MSKKKAPAVKPTRMVDKAKAKQALPFQRGANVFTALPEELYVEERPGHKYYEPRVHDEPTEAEVAWAVENGIADPVKIVMEGDRAVVIDGRRRRKIALLANPKRLELGLPPIRLTLRPASPDAGKRLAWSIVANNHREAEDEVTQAFKLRDYLDLGYSEEDARVVFRWETVKTIKNRLELLRLDPAIHRAIREKRVTVTQALKWVNLPVEEQKRALAAYEGGGNKPGKHKKGPKPQTPARLRKVLDAIPSSAPQTATVLLKWILGEATDEEVATHVRGMSEALERTSKKGKPELATA